MPVIVSETSPNLVTHQDSSSLIVKLEASESGSSALAGVSTSLYRRAAPASAIAANENVGIADASSTFLPGQTLVAFAAGLGPTDPATAKVAGD